MFVYADNAATTALSPAARLATGINEFTADECSGIADFLSDNSVTLGVYQSLMDFTLSLKVGIVRIED